MKNLNKLLTLFILASSLLVLQACDDDDDDTPVVPTTNTVTDFVIDNQDNYSILLEALSRAEGNLPAVLAGTGPFTVFAPDNAAFAAFLGANGFDSLDDVPNNVLTQILLNHVVMGDVRSSALSTGYISTLSTATPNGANMSMYINTAQGVRINGVSNVIAADNVVDNGVVHLVDNVIGLPDIVTMATSNASFTNLVAALTRDDQPDFVSILMQTSDPAPFTVFAPTNDAFASLLTELGVAGLADIDAATLTATLQNHVVGGANVVAGDLSDNMTVTTLGGDITANISGGATLTDANGRVSNIVATDVQTANGVIHVIDKVVLPYIEPMTNTIADFVIANQDNYSSLLAAVQKAGLVETLMGDTKLTVFAPNNDAFDAFLQAAGFNSLDDVPVDVLTQILLNHVVMGDVRAADLTTGYISSMSTATPNGANMSMYIDTSNGVQINGASMVTGADNAVDNGVIHLVDAVIGLPTVVTMATSNGAFSNLVAALTRGDQPDFVSILSSSSDPAPFTVFAPTDAAFGDLLTELGVSGLNDIDAATLTATLQNHVVGGANVVAGDLTDNMTVTTLGGDITANVTGGATLTDANGRISNIIATDVQTANGVIHVIDKVVLPYIAPPTNNIADFVIANQANYSSLLAAVQKAGLVETLMGDTKLTVFAPDNAAFDAFLSSAGFNSIDDVPTDILTQIVLNHVVMGDVRSTDLSTGYVKSMSTATPNGAYMSMYIDTSMGVMINGTSNVTGADNVVDNGVIHLVDAVIGLPTIVTMATSNSAFSNLVAALTRGDQPDFVSVLSSGDSPAPFTVFAPTDAAFGDLLAELGVGGLGDIDGATLTATLQNHVVGGANVVAGDLMDNMTVTTLGGDITANISGGATITDANGRISNIIATDVQTANGVIHVIDKVILPYIAPPTNTIADFVIANQSNYSSLLAAVQKAGLVETLMGDTKLTVFAPDNAAFDAFLQGAGFNNIDEVPTDILTQIVLNHVVMGDVRSTDLSTGYVKSMSTATPNGAYMSMYIDTSMGVKINGGSNVTGADNVVDNGVVHLVDAVIGLPTIVTMATSNSAFSNLVAALTRDDQPDFVSILSSSEAPAPFTVFAPTDDAFASLLEELGAGGLGDIDTATLTATLQTHVVGGANVVSGDLMDNMTITTLGGDITADVTGGAKLTDANGRMANIIAVDVQTANGVIHVIDMVVLPQL